MATGARPTDTAPNPPRRGLRGHWPAIGLFLAVAVVGAFIILYHTPWGVGLTADGLFYFSAAENFAHGRGIYWAGSGGHLKPLVHFPPLYPFVLGLLLKLGVPLDEGARWLSAALFGVNASLLGLAVYLGTQHLWLGLVASVISLTSPVMVFTHLAAMSEPLYLALSLASLDFLALHLVTPRRGTLLLAGLATSLACLTRYVGASLLIGLPLALLCLTRGPLRTRLRDTLAFIGLSSVPVGLWLARNVFLTGSATNRSLGFHPPSPDTLRHFLDLVSAWMMPGLHSHWLEAAVMIVTFAALSVLSIRQYGLPERRRPLAPVLSLLALLCLASYLFLLTASLAFFDASTRLDNRILSPIYLLAVVAILCTLGSLLPKDRWSLLAIPVVLAAMWATVPYAVTESNGLLTAMRQEGLGFSSRSWRQSTTVAWLQTLSPEAVIYTDQVGAVGYLASRETHSVPQRYDPVTATLRGDYEQQLQTMRSSLQSPGAALVLFASTNLPEEAATLGDLTSGLILLAATSDAVIYVDPTNPIRPPLPRLE